MDNLRILIVDDEKDFVDSLVKRFRRRGIASDGVYRGVDAVRKVTAISYDVVLLDMLLPDQDGNSVLRQLKAVRPALRVLMLTGHASVESGRESLRHGAAEYLMKPVELETLYEKLSANSGDRRVRLRNNPLPGQSPAGRPLTIF